VAHADDHALFYATPERAESARFLLAPGGPTPVDELVDAPVADLRALAGRLGEVGLELILVDVTPPDLRQSPFRVVRALCPGVVDLAFGWGLDRRGTPRLAAAMSVSRNPLPHPLA
jgi:ribosomal protein S12 methylthiotransferase accessory factor